MRRAQSSDKNHILIIQIEKKTYQKVIISESGDCKMTTLMRRDRFLAMKSWQRLWLGWLGWLAGWLGLAGR